MHLLERLSRWSTRLLLFGGMTSVALMMTQIFCDVVLRNMLGLPIYGTIEIASNYWMVGVAFLPLAILQREGGHVQVDSFTAWVSPSVARILDIGVSLLSLVYLSFFAWATIRQAISKTAVQAAIETPAFTLPVWPACWLVSLGVAAFALVMLERIVASDADTARQGGHAQ